MQRTVELHDRSRKTPAHPLPRGRVLSLTAELMKPALLFLVHRIPYPPNKGDKVRSFNLLKQLARDYSIHLGAFVDDPHDWRYEADLRELCAEVRLVRLRPQVRKLTSLRGLLTGEALSLPYYRHTGMSAWVRRKLDGNQINRVVVYSSAMAQYVVTRDDPELHRVIDFVDVDSQKWHDYSLRHRGPARWIYEREGRRLLSFDRKVAGRFDASVFVTAEEAALFRELAPECASRVTHMDNGVDMEYFTPDVNYPNPYGPRDRVLVFTGAMDYWPNVDAVVWFAREVFPRIRDKVPHSRFMIVGARPAESVRQLGAFPGVHVTGAVKDIRPYLAHAALAVAPLRVARGIQNKVLEAMAMAKPVLATPAAMDGIRDRTQLDSLVAEGSASLADLGARFLTSGDREGLGGRGRALVQRHYAWARNLQRFEALLRDRAAVKGIVGGAMTDQPSRV